MGLGMSACTKDEPVQEAVTPVEEPIAPPAVSDASDFAAETVYFSFDSAELTAESQSKLAGLAEHMGKDEACTVQIEGHCDERGTTQYNLALGERRALAVKGYLSNLGVTESRITTISYGEERPKVTGHTEESWSQNRRAEFNISK